MCILKQIAMNPLASQRSPQIHLFPARSLSGGRVGHSAGSGFDDAVD
jgi:hypothetical protein